MPDPLDELIGEWLTRAEHDLRVAEFLLTMPEPPPESIGFHAQQCAEKALKAYLTLRRVDATI
jgi:HEPN domain-containing protein